MYVFGLGEQPLKQNVTLMILMSSRRVGLCSMRLSIQVVKVSGNISTLLASLITHERI